MRPAPIFQLTAGILGRCLVPDLDSLATVIGVTS